jgi:hypothetical protein
MLKYLLILFFILSPFKLPSQEIISSSEAMLLSNFLHTALLDSSLGFLLFDKKPVCLIEYNRIPLNPNEYLEQDALSIAINNVEKILSKPIYNSGNINFVWDEKTDTLIAINKKIFLKTVQDNLPLFQYGLNPLITPEALLNELVSSNRDFDEVFNYDRVLIGIVLGFGVQNSLIHSRLENIMCDQVALKDTPPMLISAKLIMDDHAKSFIQCADDSAFYGWRKNKQLSKCYGYSSLQDELLALRKILHEDEMIDTLRQEKPYFIFGYNEDDIESKKLLKEINATKTLIQNLNNSPEFLREIIHIVCGRDIEFESPVKFTFDISIDEAHNIIAKILLEKINKFPKEYYSYFTDGLIGKIEQAKPNYTLISCPEIFQIQRKSSENLAESDRFFSTIQSDDAYVKVIDNMLYYKILAQGVGSPLRNETSVVMDYEIYGPNENLISRDKEMTINLEDTIPGFYIGVTGMKIGEEREINIHPALAYGLSTLLDKNMRLKAIVKLHKMYSKTSILPSNIEIDVQFLDADDLVDEEQSLQQSLSYMGIKTRKKLLQYPLINLEQVANVLKKLDGLQVISNNEITLLNQFLWNQQNH